MTTRCSRSFIGPEILGLTALGNQKGGVLLTGHAYANAIGAINLTPANLISGNYGIGVLLRAGHDPEPRDQQLHRPGPAGPRGCRTPAAPIVNHGSRNTIRGNRT